MEWLLVLLSEKNDQQSYFQGPFLPLFYYNVKRVFNINDQEKLKGKTKFEICGRSSYSTIHKTQRFDNGFEKKKILVVRAE